MTEGKAYRLDDISDSKVATPLDDLSQPESPVTVFERSRHVSIVVYSGDTALAGSSTLPTLETVASRLTRPDLPVVVRWVSSGEPAADRDSRHWIENIEQHFRNSGRTVRIFPRFEGTQVPEETFCTDLVSALRGLDLLEPGKPNPEIVEAFQRAVLTFFQLQLNTEVKIGKAIPRPPGGGLQGFSSWMEFRGGSAEVAAALTLPREGIEALVQRMLGDTSRLKQQEVWAGICEFLNIISGLAKAHLNAKGYALKSQGLPALYVPEYRQSLFDEDGSTRIEIPLETPHGAAELELRFYN